MEVLTHIEVIRSENQTVKEQVQIALNWSSQQYAEFQEAMGYAYLQEAFINNPEIINEIAKEKLFWSWWINHWVSRDKYFLSDTTGLNEAWKLKLYTARNNPASAYFKLAAKIMEQSYAVMIGQLIKELQYD